MNIGFSLLFKAAGQMNVSASVENLVPTRETVPSAPGNTTDLGSGERDLLQRDFFPSLRSRTATSRFPGAFGTVGRSRNKTTHLGLSPFDVGAPRNAVSGKSICAAF